MSANRTILYNSKLLNKLRCFCCYHTNKTQFQFFLKHRLSFKIKNKITNLYKTIFITVDEFGFYGVGEVNIIIIEQTKKKLIE